MVLLTISWSKGVDSRFRGFKDLFSKDFINAWSILSTSDFRLAKSLGNPINLQTELIGLFPNLKLFVILQHFPCPLETLTP